MTVRARTTGNAPVRSRALGLLLALSACYSPTPGNGQLHCSPSGACPEGFVCGSDDTCYANGAFTAPAAPLNVSAAPGIRSAQITWSAPAHDGGSAITGYVVTASPGSATASTSGSGRGVTILGLDNATTYTFTVVATNAIGSGLASAPSLAITTYGMPGAPLHLTASGSLHSASLDWTAPTLTGGSPITGYLFRASQNGGAFVAISASVTGTHAVIAGLATGGSYAFEVAAVNAVGAGAYSTASAPVVLAVLPLSPVITAPAIVTSQAGNVVARVPSVAGESYTWTVTGAQFTNPDGAAGEIVGGFDSVTLTVTAFAGGQVGLSCVASNAVGSSSAGTFSASVVAAPSLPSIVAPAAVSAGDTSISAHVTAHDGMTYSWTLSSNATLRSASLHGDTSGGANTLLFDVGPGVSAGDLIQLSVVEVNAAAVASQVGTKAVTIAGLPSIPQLSAPAAVVVGEQGAVASVTAHAGMTYLWTLAGANFSSGSSQSGTTSGGANSIHFNVTASLGGTVAVSVVELNLAQRASSPAAASITVASLPSSLPISVALDNGVVPAQFQSGVHQSVTQGASAVVAQVAQVPNASYAWQIISGGAQLHASETGTASSFKFDVTGLPGSSGSGTIALRCTLSIGSSSVQGNQSVTIVAAPVAPGLSLDSGGASLSVTVGDSAAHTAAIALPVSTSTYAWSAAPPADLTSLGASGASVSFTLLGSLSTGTSITLRAIETNAAGRVGTTAGTGAIHVIAAPAQPTITAPAFVTIGDTGITATLPAHAGMSYLWTLSSNATLRSPDLHGVTVSGINTLSFDLNGTAAIGDQVALSAVEVNAAGTASASATAAIGIADAPATPTLTAPGAVAAGQTGATASVVARAGMTYAWSLTGANFSSGSSSAGTTSGSTNAINFDVTASSGGTVSVSVVESNAAARASSAASSSIPVGTLPGSLPISIALDDGAVPANFQSGATQYVTQAAVAVVAKVSTIPNATYAWTIVSGGASAHAGETGTANTFSFDVTGTPGNISTGTILLRCTATIGSSNVQGTATAQIVAAPVVPSLSIDSGGSSRSLTVGNNASHTAAVVAPVSTSSYAWSAAPSGDLTGLGSSGSSVTFALAGSVSTGTSITLRAVETNAAGRASSSAGTAALTVVAVASAPTVSVSPYATDPSSSGTFGVFTYTATLTPGATAGASYAWTVTGGGSCVGNLCGIAPASGADITSASFDYTVTAALGTTLTFSAVALNAAGDASAVSATATQVVIAAPQAPALTPLLSIPGAPSGLTFTAVAPSTTYDLSVPTHANMTYRWELQGVDCIAHATCTDKSTSGTSAIEFTVPANTALGSYFSIQVFEKNRAGIVASAGMTPPVEAAPSVPSIVVVDHFANTLDNAHLFITAGKSATAYVARSALQSYLWSATGRDGTTSVLDGVSTTSGAPGTDGNSNPINSIGVIGQAYAIGEEVRLNLTTWNAAAFATTLGAGEIDLVLEPAPHAPTITIHAIGDDSAPTTLTDGVANVSVSCTTHTNADASSMTYGWSVNDARDLSGSITPGAAPHSSATFSIASSPPSTPMTLSATETNAAGDTATGTLSIPLRAPISVTAISPANGATDVHFQPPLIIDFSAAPDPSSLQLSGGGPNSCASGGVTFHDNTANVNFGLQEVSLVGSRLTLTESNLIGGHSYTLTVIKSATCGLTDAQGVPLAQASSTTFTAHVINDISALAHTTHLQSVNLSWTDPTAGDPWFKYISIYQIKSGSAGGYSQSPNSPSVLDSLLPNSTYFVRVQVVDQDPDGNYGFSDGQSFTTTTAFSGSIADFQPKNNGSIVQTAHGLGWTLDASGYQYGFTWDANALYVGVSRGASGLAAGDTLWVGMDTDGAGHDTHGTSQITYDHSNSHSVTWPFLLDEIATLSRSDGTLPACDGSLIANGTYVARLFSTTDSSGGCTSGELAHWSVDRLRTQSPVVVAGSGKTMDEFAIPLGANLLADVNGATPSHLRLAFAFIHAPTGSDGANFPGGPTGSVPFVTDVAPANLSATDTLGGFASITSSFDTQGNAFGATGSDLTASTGNVVTTSAPALVAFHLDGSDPVHAGSSLFAPTDAIQILGHQLNGSHATVAVPPLAPLATESHYRLFDDGTHGDTTSGDLVYSGLFNFGGAPKVPELDFFFAKNGTAEPLFGNGHDRVYTLSGASEIVTGSQQSPDNLVWGTVYSATHPFDLTFQLTNSTGEPVAALAGNATELDNDLAAQGNPASAFNVSGQVVAGKAVLMTATGANNVWSLTLPMGHEDFVSSTPLEWVALFSNGVDNTQLQSEANIHTMNDDVINTRTLSWANGDTSTF